MHDKQKEMKKVMKTPSNKAKNPLASTNDISAPDSNDKEKFPGIMRKVGVAEKP